MNIPTGIGSLPQSLNVQSSAAVSAENVKSSVNGASAGQDDAAKVSVSAGLLTQDVGGSDVRAGRVQELQAAIAAGTYSVPASAVADKLIESMLG